MRIKELSEKQLLAVLINDGSKGGGIDHEGETLAEFIELSGLSERSSVTELHEALVRCGIRSPFRELSITTTVTRFCGYTIAVTDEQYARFIFEELGVDELEPSEFNLEDAFFETEFGENVSSSRNYTVSDGFGRSFVDWDRRFPEQAERMRLPWQQRTASAL